MAGIFDFLFGSSDKLQQVPTMNPQQQQVLSQLLSQLGMGSGVGGNFQGANDYISQLLEGSPDAFNRFEQPYLRQFNEQTVPGLAERFAGAGAMGGGLSSSGFGQALSSAGAGLSDSLAALRAQLQGGAANQAMGQYNQTASMGLGANPFGYERLQGSPGVLGQALGIGLGGGLGNWMNNYGGNNQGNQNNSPNAAGALGGASSFLGGTMGDIFRNMFGATNTGYKR
jgi:hypothetical protein